MEKIRASELRIGNFIYNTVNKCEFQIDCFLGTEYCTNKCEFETQEFDAKLEECEPIPLTKERLFKFNEVRKFGGTIYLPLMNLKAEIHFEIYGNHIVSTIKSDFAELILDPIKYVHQLQNLYFALTGEELLLSLPQ